MAKPRRDYWSNMAICIICLASLGIAVHNLLSIALGLHPHSKPSSVFILIFVLYSSIAAYLIYVFWPFRRD
jgi:hypothetical protein